MPGSDFDIYETDSGYVAVTHEVRRAILAALGKKDRQLPELVKITKKAKPTLSSIHIRELLRAKLVEELAHPTDKRKKIYRLRGRRIGTSNLPVGELRQAVRTYAGAARATGVRLSAALDAIAAAPASAAASALRAQARRLGQLVGEDFHARTPREGVAALAALLERDGIARPLKLDLEGLLLELELEREMEGDPARLASLVAGLAEGILDGRTGDTAGRVRLVAHGGRRLTLGIPGAAG